MSMNETSVLNSSGKTIEEIRNQFAVTASSIGVWDWDLVTNKVYYSKESLEILEIDEEELFLLDTPEKWDERVHPDDRKDYFGNIQKHFNGEIPYYETYHRVLCRGKYKWVLDRGKVIDRDVDGKPLRIVGTHTDVSAQKEREEKVLNSLNVVNSQKNKLLNFAHIVSHNLRNHAGNLSSLLKLNEQGMFEKEEFLTYLKTVSNELSSSIDNLVDLVKVQNHHENEKFELNVGDFLKSVFNILSDDIKKNNTEIINLVPSDFTIMFNAAYLESVLLNLTSNAIKYSNPERLSSVIFSVDYVDDYKVLVVKDNGLGIDMKKFKDHVFGLYKTFHKKSDSIGVGLHITKNQVEALEGKIEFDCEVNGGCTFKVFFKK